MKKISCVARLLVMLIVSSTIISTGCSSGTDFLSSNTPIPVITEAVTPLSDGGEDNPAGGGDPGGGGGGGITIIGPYHALFSYQPGVPISSTVMSSYYDTTGFTITTDWDGDGIPNDDENAVGSNPYVTDYPRITVKTSHPIVMELEMNVSGEIKTHSEHIDSENTKETSSENMDETHYTKLNLKTTPYVVKGSSSEAGEDANAYGYQDSKSISTTMSFPFGMPGTNPAVTSLQQSTSTQTSKSENFSFKNSFSRSSMSEKTVFDNIDYHDNMDSNGIQLKNDKVMEMERRYRSSEIESTTTFIGPNAGVVRAALYFKNESLDKPVRLSNVWCTLLLKKPGGQLEALQTFMIKDREGYPFEVEIGGGDETPPYAVELTGISSEKVKRALRNGYIPVVSIFSYDLTLPDDSVYQPGVENLKQVVEVSKGRTALIKIVAPTKRELHRVVAFDEDDNGNLVPGISLKKALFNIYRSALKGGEQYDVDIRGESLTVQTGGLWWHNDYVSTEEYNNHEYIFTDNYAGNEWDYFATEVKTYTDEYNATKRIETIKRIGNERDKYGEYLFSKFNPFDEKDNPNYDENEPLTEDALLNTKYWVILHNGKYYEGDINDPIWPGDRYEIILYNIMDFKEHFDKFIYTPIQSGELMKFDTRWNALTNSTEEMARSVKLGRVYKGDVIKLDVYLRESRFLFDNSVNPDAGAGIPHPVNEGDVNSPYAWWDYKYTFEPVSREPNGIPESFSHKATGDVNNVTVTINEARYVHYYMIDLLNIDDPTAIPKKVRVDLGTLRKLGGVVFLHSRTKDINGNDLGTIAAGNYTVTVYAHGVNYGHQVKTRSITNGQPEAQVEITDATELEPSSSFTYSAVNLYTNKLHVRISEQPNTEYYLVRLIGPYNYETNPAAMIEYRCHSGLNVLDVPTPATGGDEPRDPGVYEVHVYAVNNNCYNGGIEVEPALVRTESQIGLTNVNVEYEMYQKQRVIAPYKWVPEAELDNDRTASAKNFNLNAVDIEVNFNEGSGWWRLKLAHDDKGVDNREIDCRFTSKIDDYRGQHFVIYFKPPDGTENQYHNVFRSSDEEVTIYMRTVAEERYRDTFWQKKLGDSPVMQPGMNFVMTDNGVNDFIHFWNNREETDASKFEETLEAWRIESSDYFNPGSIGIVEPQPNNDVYFFSPLEQRKYYVSATFAPPTDYVKTTPTKLDFPRFQILPGPGCVYVNNIESQYADSYQIWWRRYDRNMVYDEIEYENIGWDPETDSGDEAYWQTTLLAETDSVDGKFSYTIPGLDPNQFYLVAVVGKNFNINGTSDARFYGDMNDSGDNIKFLLTYPTGPAANAPLMNLAVDSRCITVDIATLPDQNRYIIDWKSDSGTEWTHYDTYDGTPQSLLWDQNVSYTFCDLNAVTNYTVKARAVTLNNLEGPETVNSIVTGTEGSIIWNLQWDRSSQLLGYGDGVSVCFNAGLFMDVSELPAGTAYYTISGTATSGYYTSWLFLYQGPRNFPFNIQRDVTETGTVVLFNVAPLHAWWGIAHTASYKDFDIQGSITAHAADGSVIDQQDVTFREDPSLDFNAY